jgi:chemotaxis protein methyltransferase CheR
MTGAGQSEAVYDRLFALVSARTGLVFPASRRPFAELGLRRAMAKAGVADAYAYLDGLAAGTLPLDELAGELTVSETYFFREPDQFEFIRRRALPEILRLRADGHVIRAWSAGCASGEEAYSLAILFEEEGIGDRSHVLATDISPTALTRTRRGSYKAWSFRGDTEHRMRRYTRRDGKHRLILDRLRNRVTVRWLNLADDLYPCAATGTAQQDLILCRNVLIYLSADAAQRVMRHLVESLAEGGWLIMGPSDPPWPESAECEAVVTAEGVFYRRRGHVRPIIAPVAEPRTEVPVQAAATIHREPSRRRVNTAPGPSGDPVAEARDAFTRGRYRRVVELTTGRLAEPAACVLHVRALANLGEADRSEKAASIAAARHPLCPELHFLQGVLLLGRNRREEAVQALKKVLYLDPGLGLAHLTLGSVLQQDGALREARRAFQNALARLDARPPGEAVPLSDGDRAGSLADAARAHLARLDAVLQGGP